MTTRVVEIRDLSKRFVIRKEKSVKERLVNWGRSQKHKDDFWALRDVTLDIDLGTTVGLVGPNGSGKSTLLKMIGGILQPTSGSVLVRGRIAALLELGAGFHPDLTGRENVYLNAAVLGISRSQTDKYFDEIVEFSGIEPFIDTQVKFYSSGMYVRLAFAVAVHVDPDILLVDEVLAVGDEPFQKKCLDRIELLQAEGRTIVFVSHALGQVEELCDRAVVLRSGQVIADGPPIDALVSLRSEFKNRREQDLAALAALHGGALPTYGLEEMPTIDSVRLYDFAGNALKEIGPHGDIVVAVTVNAPVPITGHMVGCRVDTDLGAPAIMTDNSLVNVKLGELSGKTRVDFKFTDLRLAPGKYTLSGVIYSPPGGELDRIQHQSPFRVTGDGRTLGTTWAESTAQVVR